MPSPIQPTDKTLTIQHYKEPLLPLEKKDGFGYWGCLSVTNDGEFVQCHICGKLYESLGFHVYRVHGMTANEYRDKFKLTHKTSLVSEAKRQRQKNKFLEYLSSLTPEQRAAYKKKAIENSLKARAKNGWKTRAKDSLETKNKRGTCPDQLIAKVREIRDKLGHTPSTNEFIDMTGGDRYMGLICYTFGSWRNCLKKAKLPPKVRDWKGMRGTDWDDGELLEFLSDYAKTHKKIPTTTDCKRGLIPGPDTYQRHFGSFERARELAGVYDYVDKESLGYRYRPANASLKPRVR